MVIAAVNKVFCLLEETWPAASTQCTHPIIKAPAHQRCPRFAGIKLGKIEGCLNFTGIISWRLSAYQITTVDAVKLGQTSKMHYEVTESMATANRAHGHCISEASTMSLGACQGSHAELD